MPLFRAEGRGAKVRPRRRRMSSMEWMGSGGQTDEDGSVLSLTRLCLLSLADNMKGLWTKDYADNYLDQYTFRYIMGPFNLLPGELLEELTVLLCSRKQMTRAALHLLLLPQLRVLSLDRCPCLVTAALCSHITARCQGLWSLDLSGGQQLPSKVLSDSLCCLPALRSLSLAGTPCDRPVIRTIARHCRLLRHLDISRCRFLSPAALLPLGGVDSFSSSCSSSSCTSTSQPLPPLPLSSLLALDIGFGEEEGDPVATAAFLLLSLPRLERVALEGLAQACALIQHRQFSQTEEFTDREGVPRLGEVWRQRTDIWRKREASEEDEEEEEERILWDGSESEENARDLSGSERLILLLKDIKGLSCDSLDSLSQVCPNVQSISVNIHDDDNTRGLGSLLAAIQAWSGQLQRLSVHYPGPLEDLLPALQVAGSSLVSLTLEGVKTSPEAPLLELIKACPRLRDLHVSAEPPSCTQREEDEEEDDLDLPQLPDLCSLTINFSYEHGQMKPVMSWMSLKRALRCLLAGSPLLERVSLVSLPCPLNGVLQDVLDSDRFADSTDSPPRPLGRVRRVHLPRTDVKMKTVRSLMQRSQRLKYVDVSYCWQIRRQEWLDCERVSQVQVVWL